MIRVTRMRGLGQMSAAPWPACAHRVTLTAGDVQLDVAFTRQLVGLWVALEAGVTLRNIVIQGEYGGRAMPYVERAARIVPLYLTDNSAEFYTGDSLQREFWDPVVFLWAPLGKTPIARDFVLRYFRQFERFWDRQPPIKVIVGGGSVKLDSVTPACARQLDRYWADQRYIESSGAEG